MHGRSNKNRHTVIPLAYGYYFIPTLMAVISAMVNSIYLAVTHYKNYTDFTYQSFCAISRSINCDTVAQSPWAFFAGLPVAYWGLFGYLLFFYVLLQVRKNKDHHSFLWAFLVLLSSVFAGVAVYLSYISFVKIDSYCILCLFNHLISFVLLGYSLIAYKRFGSHALLSDLLCVKALFLKKSNLLAIGALTLLFVCLWIFMPTYWRYEPLHLDEAIDVKQGMTQEGNPWIGSENAETTIHIYSDYMCFQCGKIHHFLRSMIANEPGKYKLVVHHYPLDHAYNPIVVKNPYHVGSGKMAQLAVFAMIKGKFWKMNDALFEIGRNKTSFSTERIAEKTGFTSGELVWALQQQDLREIVDTDIRRGLKLRITSTPSFVVDGRVYSGRIPEEILK